MVADLDAVLRAHVLAGVARDVLRALDDRMDADTVRDAREALDLVVCHIAVKQEALRDGDALFGLLNLLAAVLRGEHALAQAIERLLVGGNALFHLVFGDVAKVGGGSKSSDSALDHGRGGFLDARDIACSKDTRNARLAEVVHDRHLAAALPVVHDVAAIHLEELRHRGEADSDADRIDVEMLLGARDELEVRVDLGNRDAGHVVRALGTLDRVGEIERDARAGDLCGMHAVATDMGSCIDERHDVAACLLELVADDEANIAGAEHEDTLARLHAVQVHHRLGSAGADDTRKRPALERDHVLGCARGDDDCIALVVVHFGALADDDLLVLVEADDGRVKLDLDAELCRLIEELLADNEATDLGAVLLRAEELVDLLEKLAARTSVLVEDDDGDAVLCCLDGSGHAGGAGTDNDQIVALHAAPPSFPSVSSKGTSVTPYWVSTFMPSTRGVMHVLTLGTPSTTITQSVQRPIAQKMPRGWCFLAV